MDCRYLARAVPNQTVFLIAAEQVQYLSDYMALARLLQPSMVIVEDVDLIAKQRADHDNPASEVLLNKLLNEMDGLNEDAAVLFILTTNRPEALEVALTARPGRIDQAIEFPLPDASGRDNSSSLFQRNRTRRHDGNRDHPSYGWCQHRIHQGSRAAVDPIRYCQERTRSTRSQRYRSCPGGDADGRWCAKSPIAWSWTSTSQSTIK